MIICWSKNHDDLYAASVILAMCF